MLKNKLNNEKTFMGYILIGFFTALIIVFVLAMITFFKAIITYPNAQKLPSVIIQSCYDGDTCTSTEGEKIRLACIDTHELKGKRADPIRAKAAKDYLNDLVAGSKLTIRRINLDRYGRTVAELSKGAINIQEQLVEKKYASIYEKYASHCEWSKK
tara:strand:- start:219 stop:686 length:468 start_codon:yes stop_codon:yes gene_type:complete